MKGDGLMANGVTVIGLAASVFKLRASINSLRVDAASSTSSEEEVFPIRSRLLLSLDVRTFYTLGKRKSYRVISP
jgi:hypothetical protein